MPLQVRVGLLPKDNRSQYTTTLQNTKTTSSSKARCGKFQHQSIGTLPWVTKISVECGQATQRAWQTKLAARRSCIKTGVTGSVLLFNEKNNAKIEDLDGLPHSLQPVTEWAANHHCPMSHLSRVESRLCYLCWPLCAPIRSTSVTFNRPLRIITCCHS